MKNCDVPPYLKCWNPLVPLDGYQNNSQKYRFSKNGKKQKEGENMAQQKQSARLQVLNGNPNKRNVTKLKKQAENEQKLKMNTDNLRKPPAWLDKEGKKAFIYIVQELKSVDLVGNADLYAIAIYADSYSQYLKYRRIVKATGNWVDGKPNPYITKMENAAKQMRGFGADLGLTPHARIRLAASLAEQEDGETDDY